MINLAHKHSIFSFFFKFQEPSETWVFSRIIDPPESEYEHEKPPRRQLFCRPHPLKAVFKVSYESLKFWGKSISKGV